MLILIDTNIYGRYYANGINCIKIRNVLGFFSPMFDKEVIYFTMNSAKCVVATSLHTPTYISIYKHPLFMKYVTEIFNLRPQKLKISNV